MSFENKTKNNKTDDDRDSMKRKKSRKKKKKNTNYKSQHPSPPPLTNKSAYDWSVDEVIGWIASLDSGKYTSQCKKFKSSLINGTKLMSLNRMTLQNEVNIYDAAARNAILKGIKLLKKTMKQMEEKRINKFASTHTRRQSKKLNNIQNIENEYKIVIQFVDDPLQRVYSIIKMKTNKANSTNNDVGTDYDIQNIVDDYDIDMKSINLDKCILIDDESANIGDKNKTIKTNPFMFILRDIENDNFVYLFTKNISEWNIENVFEFVSNITNKKFMLFAHEFKKKKVDGNKLLKYDISKIRKEYLNYFDSVVRKKMMEEINLLKKQLLKSDTECIQKTYHIKYKRSPSQIIRHKTEKQKMRKQGPRDIGKIKYHGTKYDYNRNSVLFGAKIHPLAKDERFQKRKKQNPLPKKQTVNEIGIVHGFKGQYELEDVDDNYSFLDDRVCKRSRTKSFELRQRLNPIQKKKTVDEIGIVHGYKKPEWSHRISIEMKENYKNGIFEEKIKKNTKNYQELAKLNRKKGAIEIGKNIDFKKPKWSHQVSQRMKEDYKNGLFGEKIKRASKNYQELAKLTHKAGAVEIGKNKDFDGINYDLSEDDLNGDFLEEKLWYDASKINERFDDGIGNISHLLKELPSHKLRIMDKQPLPTGTHTKIVWLKKLRGLVVEELDKQKQIKSMDKRMLFKRKRTMNHLKQLDGILVALQDNNDDNNDDDDDDDIDLT